MDMTELDLGWLDDTLTETGLASDTVGAILDAIAWAITQGPEDADWMGPVRTFIERTNTHFQP
jgi:hypothetical protein